MGKYINPFTDFGFKYIFGREKSKPLLMSFLNELMRNDPGFEPIEKIEYSNNERGSNSYEE